MDKVYLLCTIDGVVEVFIDEERANERCNELNGTEREVYFIDEFEITK